MLSIIQRIEVGTSTRRLSPFSLLESEGMSAVRLAQFVIAFAGNVAKELVAVQTNRAEEVFRLPVRHIWLELEYYITFAGLKELVSILLSLELVLAQQLSAQSFQSVAKLHVRHIRHRQFVGESVQQL